MDALVADHAYAGWILAAVTVDPALLDDKTERINITLPRRVLLRLDALARALRQAGVVAHGEGHGRHMDARRLRDVCHRDAELTQGGTGSISSKAPPAASLMLES